MTRDWPTINEALIRRGEFNLSLFHTLGEELQETNRGEEGGRYMYPATLITLQAHVLLQVRRTVEARLSIRDDDEYRKES